MSTATVTVLDYVDRVTVPGDVFAQPANEYWALICLRDGLEFLYRQSLRCDEIANEGLGVGDDRRLVGIGNVPGLELVPKTLLTCAFHWYAIAACNYVRTVGAIAYRQSRTRPLPAKYAEQVIPEVLAFRDKVAAHFSWATQNSRDNQAEQVASILPPLSFDGRSFQVGAFAVVLKRNGKESDSQAIAPWSIRETHERLRLRYWPYLLAEAEAISPAGRCDALTPPSA